jgi:hypothetical protein
MKLMGIISVGLCITDYLQIRYICIHKIMEKKLEYNETVHHLFIDFKKDYDSVRSLLPPAHTGSSLMDFSILKMEAIRSSKTSVHTRSTRYHIPEHSILKLLFNLILYPYGLKTRVNKPEVHY